MDAKNYWKEKHQKYATKSWIDEPTMFAKFAVNYFPEEGKVLELGAGQGQDSRFFASKGYEVISTDFSEEALEMSKQKKEKLGVDLQTQVIDISDRLPFDEESFDVVYSHLALHYFNKNKTKEVFEEIHRILKDGGILVALFNTMDDPEIKDLEKIEEHYYKTPSGIFKSFFTTDYLQEIIADKFEVTILDAKGETHKDEIKTLIRFIGKKI